MDGGITPEQAREELDVAEGARRRVSAEIGLPRGYWWALAGGWVGLGLVGEVGPAWLAAAATIAFGIGHSTLASRLLDGRRRTSGVQISAATAGRRTAAVLAVMLIGLVCTTIVAGMALHADGADHAGVWAGVLVATAVGFGGPEMLQVMRRWAKA
ncbi:hypothetical protein JRC04_15235 [Mycolicibacterium sp. S2-37]|uniref:hypothetical protein n=1 Tax=Mycolicibacterium sp. S2-37 TaxID=2810297 RepID=UPI001A941F4C|nr:hypothetical protein [Mycolicibacterium sp. S2-37]MBO0678819.1 hypothetical protein [Mycolicibacterium sp. S2-37]